MDYKEFFEKYGHTELPAYSCNLLSIEETYQAFKKRLMDEIEIFCSKMTNKNDRGV